MTNSEASSSNILEDIISETNTSMSMHEAAHRALLDLDQPTHIKDLVKYMETKKYFYFGAKNPSSALDTCLARHSDNVAITRHQSAEIFHRYAPATYGLLEWWENRTEEIQKRLVEKKKTKFQTQFRGGRGLKSSKIFFNAEGNPEFVLLPYSEYKELLEGKRPQPKEPLDMTVEDILGKHLN